MTDEKWLVPVTHSVTIRYTVGYVTAQAVQSETAGPKSVHFVYPLARQLTPGETAPEAQELLDLIPVWTEEDLGETETQLEITTAVIGADQYMFHPGDFANVLAEYARDHQINTVLLDPDFRPGGRTPLYPPLSTELERRGLAVREAPIERPVRRARLVRRAGIEQFGLLFVLSFGFYLVIGGSLIPFDILTGITSGLITALLLWQISFTGPVRPKLMATRLFRMVIYVPFLLWEIAKANIEMAYVVLHPALPIDPKTVEFDAAVWSEIPVTTLANSITLTPGTLTVDVTRRHFTVHTLTQSARESLFSGTLEQGVRFVFYGRRAARIPSPKERMERSDGE